MGNSRIFWYGAQPGPFKIANNSDSGFEAMIDLLSDALVSGKRVQLEVGPGNEIDKVTLLST